MRSGPTIKDIAQAVGVTPATVSYVLSRNPRQSISAQTRQKVLDAARELGYVPNGAAKVLRNAPSYCVGVAIEKELMLSRFSLVLQGIRNRLESEGYNLMLCSFGQRHGIYPDYIRNMLERRVDGVIFMGKDNTGPTPEAEELILRHQLPFVLYDCGYADRPYSTVDLGYEQAAFELTGRLLAQGARQLLYLRPQADNYQEQQREAGVRRALAARPGCRLRVLPVDTARFSDGFSADERLNKSAAMDTGALLPDLDEGLLPGLADAVLPLLAGFEAGDAVLVSWGAFALPVCRLLESRAMPLQAASLSDMAVPVSLQGRVTVCQLPVYRSGDECARLLLARLAGDTTPCARVMPIPLGDPIPRF